MSIKSRRLEVRTRAGEKIGEETRKGAKGYKQFARMTDTYANERNDYRDIGYRGRTFDERVIIIGKVRMIIGQTQEQTVGI